MLLLLRYHSLRSAVKPCNYVIDIIISDRFRLSMCLIIRLIKLDLDLITVVAASSSHVPEGSQTHLVVIEEEVSCLV